MAQPPLTILGAVYGLSDVLQTVKSLVNKKSNILTFEVNNTNLLGDSWPSRVKTFVVVYQYGEQLPQIKIAEESQTVTITYVPTGIYTPSSNVLTILGAAYGRGEMTSKVQSCVVNNHLVIDADNATFFDTWPRKVKTLVIVYQYNNKPPKTHITVEGNKAKIYSLD